MFKKSLLAVAVLGTAAGFACAADVTLYGIVDTGLLYQSNKVTAEGQEYADTKTFGLESGVSSASRFGLTGTEDLGNGLKVGFKLENGFNTDDGTLGNDGRLFGREASLTVSGDFGALSMGRMGGIGSAAGTYNVVFSTADAFDGGDNAILGLAQSDRFDNMITYQTPKFAGVQGTFQYSFKQNNKEEGDYREGSAATDRYASAALTGEFGALNTVLGYEFFNWASNDGAPNTAEDTDDGHVVYLGGNYDCGFAKTFVWLSTSRMLVSAIFFRTNRLSRRSILSITLRVMASISAQLSLSPAVTSRLVRTTSTPNTTSRTTLPRMLT